MHRHDAGPTATQSATRGFLIFLPLTLERLENLLLARRPAPAPPLPVIQLLFFPLLHLARHERQKFSKVQGAAAICINLARVLASVLALLYE